MSTSVTLGGAVLSFQQQHVVLGDRRWSCFVPFVCVTLETVGLLMALVFLRRRPKKEPAVEPDRVSSLALNVTAQSYDNITVFTHLSVYLLNK